MGALDAESAKDDWNSLRPSSHPLCAWRPARSLRLSFLVVEA